MIIRGAFVVIHVIALTRFEQINKVGFLGWNSTFFVISVLATFFNLATFMENKNLSGRFCLYLPFTVYRLLVLQSFQLNLELVLFYPLARQD